MTRLLDFLEKTLLGVTSAMFLFIVIVTLLQVFFRYILNDALSWSAELTKIVFVWMTFLGSAVAINRNRHMRIDTLVQLVPERPRVIIDILLQAAIIVFLIVISYHGLAIIERSARILTGALRWPRSVFFLPVVISGVLRSVYSLRVITQSIRRLAGKEEV